MDRTALIRQGLEEARSMLAPLSAEPAAAGLADRLAQIEERLERWDAVAPNRMERAATINDVVTLKMDVSRLRQLRTSGIMLRESFTSDSPQNAVKTR